jgi:predicted  nucleic acid-binding Zn-ribbon protein
LPAPPKNLESKITFEDIENEIEQNLLELRTLYERLQDLNKDLGKTVMHKEFLTAVERLKLESHFKFVGKEEARRLISKEKNCTNFKVTILGI